MAPCQRLSTLAVLVAVLACSTISRLAAQERDAGPALATRESLTAELARLEQDGNAGARARAALIRARLETGDFQTGDRVFIRVQGEPQLSDTFTVADGPVIDLPQVGAVLLVGALRSELAGRLVTYLGRYLRDPVVQVRPLVRILVEGDVARPGFYTAAPQQPLTDLLSQAGGISPRAKMSEMRVERGAQRIWIGQPLQEALGRGYSLDQLNLRAGDRLYVPVHGGSEKTWRIIGLLVSLPVAIYSIKQIH